MRYRISARPENTPDAQTHAPQYMPVSPDTPITFAADTPLQFAADMPVHFAADMPLRPLPFNGLVPQLAKYDDLPLLRRKRAALWRWRRRRLYVMTQALLRKLASGRGRGMT